MRGVNPLVGAVITGPEGYVLAVGRRAATKGLLADGTGVKLTDRGLVEVDGEQPFGGQVPAATAHLRLG